MRLQPLADAPVLSCPHEGGEQAGGRMEMVLLTLEIDDASQDAVLLRPSLKHSWRVRLCRRGLYSLALTEPLRSARADAASRPWG